MKETGYLVQAALIGLWWMGLASSPAIFAAFQYAGIPPVAFWAFLAPDLMFIAALSVVRAYRQAVALEHVILGAFGYATLYCCNAMLLTGSGVLPTGLMLAGLAYNLFLCFDRSLFRAASSASPLRNGVKTLIQIVCIWVLALVIVPLVILDAFGSRVLPQPGLGLWMGATMFIGFSLLGLASSYYMVRDGGGTPLPLDQTTTLVVSGPYRCVRNPMAVAGIGQGLSVALVFQSLPVLIYAILGALVWHLVVRPVEERDMVQRFGEPYVAYRSRVGCWIPRFRTTA
jgi:protein-S-isoprenylcysteine O-methyltransferase Ste14